MCTPGVAPGVHRWCMPSPPLPIRRFLLLSLRSACCPGAFAGGSVDAAEASCSKRVRVGPESHRDAAPLLPLSKSFSWVACEKLSLSGT
jgi:hypothetical protein